MFRFDCHDTQTGAKLFTAEAVRGIVPYLSVQRFAFDVEALAVAQRRGFLPIVEVPVVITYDFASTIHIGSVFRMLFDIAGIWWKLNFNGCYEKVDPVLAYRAKVVSSPARQILPPLSSIG